MKILFAPLQGYTTGIYRKAHAEIFGGVDAYYAPFLRIENGKPREKDLRDLETSNTQHPNSEEQTCAKTVPQIIANSVDEFKILTSALIAKGHTEIDFNMGCPFPMQVNRHRGSGLLSDTQTVQAIMDEIKKMSSTANGTAPINFSVKMRIGQDSPDEAFALLPILNEAPLAQITLHPRLGKQQYKGAIDFKSFEKFYNECSHPLVYNGDITSVSQICEMEKRYPKLVGVMIGRGLLARPSLATEYKAGNADIQDDRKNYAVSESEFTNKLIRMHQIIFEHACKTYQGDSQILSHVQSFWEYLELNIPKKFFKKIKKAGKLSEYQEAIIELRGLS
jgi:tRNA-dihydrouridine synthase